MNDLDLLFESPIAIEGYILQLWKDDKKQEAIDTLRKVRVRKDVLQVLAGGIFTWDAWGELFVKAGVEIRRLRRNVGINGFAVVVKQYRGGV